MLRERAGITGIFLGGKGGKAGSGKDQFQGKGEAELVTSSKGKHSDLRCVYLPENLNYYVCDFKVFSRPAAGAW
jgi:hypothetical protein